jgi:hypothetical protein
MPISVPKPATAPTETAEKWYMPSEMPTSSVHDFGTPRPITWPRKTARIPKWNSGLPHRNSRSS